MHSLASIALVSRSTETASSNASASTPPRVSEVVNKGIDSVLSHHFVLIGLAVVGALVVLSLIAYFTYRVTENRQRKDGGPLSYLRPFMPRVESQPQDFEKGRKSARELIDKISVPILLYGTGSLALDDPIMGNSKDIGQMDITEVRLDDDQDLILSGKDTLDQSQRAMESLECATEAGGAVSPELAEAIETDIAIDACSENLKLHGPGDTPVFDSTTRLRCGVVVINDEKGIEGAGLAMTVIDALRNTRELCDDAIPVRVVALRIARELCGDEIPVRAAALLTLSDKFQEVETFGKESYVAHLETGAYDEPHSFGSLSSSYSTFVTRDQGPANSAATPALYFLELMTLKSIQKLMRYISRSRTMQMHRPILTSSLASGFIIYGPGCSPSNGWKVAMRSLLPSKTIRCGPAAKSSAIISGKRTPSEFLVDVLKRMLCRGSLAEPWAAVTPYTTSIAQAMAHSLIQTPTSRLPSAITIAPSIARASQASAVPRSSNVASSSRPTKALTINKANSCSPPRTSTSLSSPEKRPAPSACTRMPTLVEEPEKDHLSLRSPPSPTIDEPRARRPSVATPVARHRATTIISGAGKISRTVKEKDFKSLRSPPRARRVAIVGLPYGFPSPPITVEFYHSARPITVGLKGRGTSKPPALKRASVFGEHSC